MSEADVPLWVTEPEPLVVGAAMDHLVAKSREFLPIDATAVSAVEPYDSAHFGISRIVSVASLLEQR